MLRSGSTLPPVGATRKKKKGKMDPILNLFGAIGVGNYVTVLNNNTMEIFTS
jgi:hypothetical protein